MLLLSSASIFFTLPSGLYPIGIQHVAPATEVFAKTSDGQPEILFQDDFAKFAQCGADGVECVGAALVFCIRLLQLILKFADAFVLVTDVHLCPCQQAFQVAFRLFWLRRGGACSAVIFLLLNLFDLHANLPKSRALLQTALSITDTRKSIKLCNVRIVVVVAGSRSSASGQLDNLVACHHSPLLPDVISICKTP